MNGNILNASLVLFLLAAGCMAAAAWLNDQIRRLELKKARAKGTVVEICSVPSVKVKPSSEFHDLYYAVIEFFADGKLVRVRSKKQDFPCSYQVGQTLTVLYDTDDPSRYEVRTNGPRDIGAFALRISGAVFLTFGVIVFLIAARR